MSSHQGNPQPHRSNLRIDRVRARDLPTARASELARRVRPPALAPATGRRRRPSPVERILPARAPRLESDALEPEAARRRNGHYRRMLGAADVLAMVLSLTICIPLLGKDDSLTPLVLAGAPLILVLAKVLDLYDREELLLRKTTLDEAPKLFQVATLMALVLWLSHPFLIDGELGRKQVLGYWLVLGGLLPLMRAGARVLTRRMVPPERVLLVGHPERCDHARAKIDESPAVHATVVAQIDFESASEADDAAAALALLTKERDIHRVVLAPPTSHGAVLDLVRAAKALGLKVSVLPRMLEVVGSSVEFDDLEGLGVLGVRRFGLTRSSWLVKRTMDVAGSALVLVLAAPAFAAIAIAIKLDSSGPVFFRQQRVGRDGRLFELFKFRTMEVGAERPKAADDPRITRVGRVLRRSSLGELPELLNVLRGEMSLVGPRPLVLEDDQRVEGWYRGRLHLTPGMTGRWQVLGSARMPLSEMVKLDYLYVANWSLWGDVKILLRTVGFMFARRRL